MKNNLDIVKKQIIGYLFELKEGRIPEVLKSYIYHRDGDVIFVKNEVGFKTALRLKTPPYDSNFKKYRKRYKRKVKGGKEKW